MPDPEGVVKPLARVRGGQNGDRMLRAEGVVAVESIEPDLEQVFLTVAGSALTDESGPPNGGET